MITIDAVDYSKCDNLYNSLNALVEARQGMKYCSNSATDAIDESISKIENELKECYKEIDSRLLIWGKHLRKYYKMHGSKKSDYGATYEFTKYIYPYRIIPSNSTLWVLEINPDDDYNGGVRDRNYTVDENWNYNITLEEVPQAEFEAAAVDSVKHVIERRMERIKFEEDNAVN